MRVRRQIRRIELWPLAKIGFVFHLVSFATTLGAGVILYHLGNRSGVIDRFTSFLGEIGFAQDFVVDGEALLRAAVPAGLALVVLATVTTVLGGALYNVVSGLLGGLIISVIEDRAPMVRSVQLPPDGGKERRRRRSRHDGGTQPAPVDAARAGPPPSPDRADRRGRRSRSVASEQASSNGGNGRSTPPQNPASDDSTLVAVTRPSASSAPDGRGSGAAGEGPSPEGPDDDWFLQPPS